MIIKKIFSENSLIRKRPADKIEQEIIQFENRVHKSHLLGDETDQNVTCEKILGLNILVLKYFMSPVYQTLAHLSQSSS
jgi:hypothetical protein